MGSLPVLEPREVVLAWRSALPGPVTGGVDATRAWEWLATQRTERGFTARVTDCAGYARAVFDSLAD